MNEYVPFLFPFLFIGLWVLVSKLLSFLGGWGALAEIYAHKKIFSGKKWLFQSARMGVVNYNSTLIIGVNREEMLFRVLIFFRVGHPDLVIPLANISGKEKKGIIFRYVHLTFARAPKVKMMIMRRLADKIESSSDWKYEREK